MRRLLKYSLILMFIIHLNASSQAGIVIYTDETAFDAATTNLTTIQFNGLAPVDSYKFFENSLVVGPVTFTDAGSSLFVIDPGFSNPTYAYSSGNQVLFDNFGGGTGLTVNLPEGVNAVSLLVGDFGRETGTITLDSGETFSFPITGIPTLNFIGFTTTDPIRSFSLQDDFIQSPALDSLQFGQTVPLPEPSTLLAACLGGLIGFVSVRHAISRSQGVDLLASKRTQTSI